LKRNKNKTKEVLSPQWKLPISIWIGMIIGQVITGNFIYAYIDGVYNLNFNFTPLVLTYCIMVFAFPYFKKYVLKQEV
jgi:uncharacterized membrane protein